VYEHDDNRASMESPQNKLVRFERDISLSEPRGYPHSEDGTAGRAPESEFHISFVDYWAVLVKRVWIVLGALLTVLILTGINTWKQTPIYRASLKLQIDTEQPNFLPFRDNALPDFTYISTEEFLKTQFEALASRTLATRVIRAMNLEKDPRFLGARQPDLTDMAVQWIRKSIYSWMPAQAAPAIPRQAATKDPVISPLAAAFVGGITVSPIKDSRVVVVSFDSLDPSLAAEALNTLATEYVKMNLETKYNASEMARTFLDEQLVKLQNQVKTADEEMTKFGQEHNIFTLSEKENVILKKFSDLNTALTEAQNERMQKESVWKTVRQTDPGQFPDRLRDEDIRKQEANIGQLQQQQAAKRAIYKPEWPELKQIANQLAVAEKQLAAAKETKLKEVETSYYTAVQKEKLLSDALANQRTEANKLNQDSITYGILKRKADSSKQILDTMLQRKEEAGVSAGLKSSNIHVVDPAEPPSSPYLPNKTANMLKALAAGLLLGVILAFFFEHIDTHLDKSIKTPDDIDRFVKLPFLGLIPSLPETVASSGRKLLPLTVKKLKGTNGHSNHGKPPDPSTVELVTHHSGKSLISEAYRDLRTSILLSASADRSPRVLLVTSSLKGEGKSTTSVNLAITLAQANERVLLMDCDMRNPSIHRIIGLPNTNGLSNFLSGTSMDSAPLIQPTQVPNLFVFSAGRVPPNPSELIGSTRMKKCIMALSEHFDRVLIDSPPVLAVTDARILATIVDGVVLVIKGGETNKEAVMRARRLLRDVHARILGTMLNNVNFHSAGSYYYSKYYYGSGSYSSSESTESHKVQ
jgi:polysaccharide biosynthesis transport protein